MHWNWSCNIQTHRSTAQETWRRDWPKRRSRDCNVTGSNENSLKKLTHYGDRDGTPLVSVHVRHGGAERPRDRKIPVRWRRSRSYAPLDGWTVYCCSCLPVLPQAFLCCVRNLENFHSNSATFGGSVRKVPSLKYCKECNGMSMVTKILLIRTKSAMSNPPTPKN